MPQVAGFRGVELVGSGGPNISQVVEWGLPLGFWWVRAESLASILPLRFAEAGCGVPGLD